MSTSIKKDIKLMDLVFDAHNPRLPSYLQKDADEAAIIDYMIKYCNMKELMLSIAETGFSDAEPLLVIQTGDKYTVIEGNRRLSALKLLNNPSLAKVRVQSIREIVDSALVVPQDIPCIVYEKREDILNYLGYRHITGVKEWGALEKARYLEQLYEFHAKELSEDGIYKKLAKMIGSRADYVLKLHRALRLYDFANDRAYYNTDVQEKDINFSWFTTAVGYRDINKYLGLNDSGSASLNGMDEGNFKKLFFWMFVPGKAVVHEVRQIGDLAKIIASEDAVAQLEKGSGIAEALLYTSAPEETFVEVLTRARQQLRQALAAIEQLSNEPEEAKDILDDIAKLQKNISGALKENFSSADNGEDILSRLAMDDNLMAELQKLAKTRRSV